LQFAHTGCVDERSASFEGDELTVRGGVAAATIGVTDLLRAETLFADESVDDGGLANTRRSEEGDGSTRPQVSSKVIEALRIASAAGDNWCVARDGLSFAEARFEVAGEVGLVEDDYWRRPTFGGQGEVAFETAKVEIAIEAADQEDEIDVGGEGLFFLATSGSAPREAGAAREDGLDDGVIVTSFAGGDPVADNGHEGAIGGAIPESAGWLGGDVSGRGVEAILIALRGCDAGENEALRGVRGKGGEIRA